MGIIKKGINGPFKGKAGSVVGSSWKKISYIKGLQRKTGTKRTPSPDQAIQQQKFKALNGFLKPISKILDIGFRQYLAKATGVNVAFSLNYDHAFLPEDDSFALDYSSLQLSHGSLFTAGAEKAWLENEEITVTWNTKTYGMGGALDDVAYAVAYSTSIDVFFSGVASRHEGIAHIDLIGEVPDGDLHVWLFFADKPGKRVSKTVYIPLSAKKP